jgi:hypothetical protein
MWAILPDRWPQEAPEGACEAFVVGLGGVVPPGLSTPWGPMIRYRNLQDLRLPGLPPVTARLQVETARALILAALPDHLTSTTGARAGLTHQMFLSFF